MSQFSQLWWDWITSYSANLWTPSCLRRQSGSPSCEADVVGASSSSSRWDWNCSKLENMETRWPVISIVKVSSVQLLHFSEALMNRTLQRGANAVTLVCRSDYSQHAVCLPHEDQEGVAVLRAHPPPAGQILRCSSCHPVNGQHRLHGTDGSRNHSLPALTSLSALPPGPGCVCPACAHGGTLLWRLISLSVWFFSVFSNTSVVSVASFRSLSCTGFLPWESLCGTSLPSQCSSASSGLFCSSCSCVRTPWMGMPR